jgi:ankyrin repeat protein
MIKPDLVSLKDVNEWTSLRIAVMQGHNGIVEFLLAKKADITAKDNTGFLKNKKAADMLRRHGGE